ncbi:Gfo/Idh/MocA family protein [Reichenbachiella sp. MSK19-1]|uniref:Gfo/Idh/MocA family protein n=1 Tax=Reichenbachiella sp. MSK19-1 TaxID=1897631 RepID=UPI000E6C9455|nr:Gfo/Idh/MocA family oxidoreductase [Reichenbachiella sp. MSK19-1]RJE71708.1 oxidoreductase [Reichenbachiella sp. MSK19-1]
MDKIKFAIIGCGRIGSRHAEHIVNQGSIDSICDIDQMKVLEFSERYSCNGFISIEEMLSNTNADVVSICTPNGLHFEHTIAALRAGKHVLCEKPMALSVDDCGKMISESLKANKRLFIVKQNRYNPPVAAVKDAIDKGKLGKILSVQLNCFWNRNEQYYENSWKGTKKLDGGSLFTQFSHFVDLLFWIVGDVKAVRGFNGNYIHEGIVEFEDHGVAILEFYNGALGTINYTTNSHGGNMEGSLTIFGEKGSVKIGGQYLNELDYQNIEDFTIEGLPPGNPPNNYGQYQGSMSNHGEVYQNVVSVLSGEGEIATNGFEGMKTVEIIDKIYSASKWKELSK